MKFTLFGHDGGGGENPPSVDFRGDVPGVNAMTDVIRWRGKLYRHWPEYETDDRGAFLLAVVAVVPDDAKPDDGCWNM